jgi:hypothetical protein
MPLLFIPQTFFQKMFTGLTLLLSSAPYLATAAHHSSSSAASSKLHNYLGHELTHEQFQDKSILLKLEYEANRDLHRSSSSSLLHSSAHHHSTLDSEATFFDVLSEIEHVKHVHGQTFSPDLLTYPAPHSHKNHKGLKKSAATTASELSTEESSHLRRSLMKKNNFIELALFSDLECQNKVRSVGRLVNYCYNQFDGSFLFKVNKKVKYRDYYSLVSNAIVSIPSLCLASYLFLLPPSLLLLPPPPYSSSFCPSSPSIGKCDCSSQLF